MWPDGGSPSLQFVEESSTQFAFQSGFYSSLASLLDYLGAGQYWNLGIELSGSNSRYRFYFAGVAESDFPNVPTFNSIQEPIGLNPTLTWSWSGQADVKGFEFVQRNQTHQPVKEGSWFFLNGEEGFDSTEQTLSLSPVPGELETRILYANLAGGMASEWTLQRGDDIIGNNRLFYVSSYDGKNVQVVPEPLSAMMIVGGFLAVRLIAWFRSLRRV